MKENLGDYLYIVMIVLAGLISLFKSIMGKKDAKKPVRQSPVFNEQAEESEWHPEGYTDSEEPDEDYIPGADDDDAYDWHPEQPVYTAPEPIYTYTREPEPIHQTFTMPTAERMPSPSKEGERVLSTKDKVKEPEVKAEEVLACESDYCLDDMEDVRRAVIYSEILNRKY